MSKKFNVFRSSAGSGKTFTLVKIFLRLCLSSEKTFAFSSILAITFTNKATYEMKHRIVDMLKLLSAGQGGVMREVLKEETDIDDGSLSAKSERILTVILHNYEDLSISTIDKFSHRIIRTFAKDLNLSLNFQVELEERELLKEIISQLIDEVGRDKSLSKLLLNFAFSKMEDEKSWKIEVELLDFAQHLLKEQSDTFLIPLRKLNETDFKELESAYRTLNKEFEENILGFAKSGTEAICKAQIQPESFAGSSKISIYFKKVQSLQVDNVSPSDQLLKNVANENWHSARCSGEQKLAIDSIKTLLYDNFNSIQELLVSEWPDYLSRREILKNYHKLVLINQIEKKFAKHKKEEGLLNISDFNKLIAEVVLSEPLPFIYERLGERYQHIMIDEFQDTSVLQFLNLLPLIEESLAKGNENLIVGDAKQAIYRFRGGEVDQFSEMPDFVPEIVKDNQMVLQKMYTLKSHYKPDNLISNFRSAEAIVAFNNDFFEFVKNLNISDKVNAIYHEHKQIISKPIGSGYVSISFQSGSSDELDQAFGDLVIENINSCRADGFELRDIAVLCRRRKQATIIAQRLKAEGIDILSSEVLLLKNSSAVMLIINVIQWLVKPDSDLCQKNVIEYMLEKGLLKECKANSHLKYLGKSGDFKFVFENAGINIDPIRLKSASILELMETLIRAFSLNKTYDAYLQALLDEALDFTKSFGSDLVQFLTWWEENENKLSATVPEEVNAVNILTIHKSKGLEYPVVIYPFATSDLGQTPSKSDLIWTKLPSNSPSKVPFALVEYNKNLQHSSLSEVYKVEKEKKEIDLINDTYVAFTRASERLYIHSKQASKNSSNLNLKSLLNDFLLRTDKFTETDGVLSMGVASKKALENVQHDTSNVEFNNLNYISEDWKKRLRLSTESVKMNAGNGAEELRKYGDLIHEILSLISDTSELAEAIESYVLKGFIKKVEAKKLEVKLNQLLLKKEVEPFFKFTNHSKREATLLTRGGKILRPDRVIYFEDQIAILDFKTGVKNESYTLQVNEYRNALAETSELPVKGYLLYTELEELVEI